MKNDPSSSIDEQLDEQLQHPKPFAREEFARMHQRNGAAVQFYLDLRWAHEVHIKKLTVVSKPVIEPAPGGWLERISRFTFSTKIFAHVYEPMIADMRHEYIEALAAGEKWHARWIHTRGVLAFCKAVMLSLPLDIAQAILARWKSG
jgi:hypothetical protein